jgi:hypothetical protein
VGWRDPCIQVFDLGWSKKKDLYKTVREMGRGLEREVINGQFTFDQSPTSFLSPRIMGLEAPLVCLENFRTIRLF